MDAMQIAQLRRQLAWHEEELRHTERDYHAAELAQENDKKKVEELKKKVAEFKRKLEGYKQELMKAEEAARKKLADERR